MALILYMHFAKKNNRVGMRFTPEEIIGTIQNMNFVSVAGE